MFPYYMRERRMQETAQEFYHLFAAMVRGKSARY
jgi:hypothetical protein